MTKGELRVGTENRHNDCLKRPLGNFLYTSMLLAVLVNPSLDRFDSKVTRKGLGKRNLKKAKREKVKVCGSRGG